MNAKNNCLFLKYENPHTCLIVIQIMAQFQGFHLVITSSINLLFIKSERQEAIRLMSKRFVDSYQFNIYKKNLFNWMKKKNCWLQSSAAEPFSDGAFNPFLIIFLAAKIWFIKSKSTVPLWENVKNCKKKFFFKSIKKLLIHPPKANNVRLLKTSSITSAEVYTSLKSDFSKVKWLQRHTRTPPDHSPSNGGGNCGSILLFLLNGYIKKVY